VIKRRLLSLLTGLLCALPAWAANPMMLAVQNQVHFQVQGVANFAHYANGAIIPGNFTAANTAQATSPTVTSGVLNPATASEVESGYWNKNAFGNDQFGFVIIGALNNVNDAVGVVLRASSGNNGYYCFVGGPTGASAFYAIAKIVSGSFSFVQAATTSPVAISVGGILGCRVTGTSIEMDYYPPTGAATGIVVITDTSLTSGSVGVYVQANEATLTNAGVTEWLGGTTQ